MNNLDKSQTGQRQMVYNAMMFRGCLIQKHSIYISLHLVGTSEQLEEIEKNSTQDFSFFCF